MVSLWDIKSQVVKDVYSHPRSSEYSSDLLRTGGEEVINVILASLVGLDARARTGRGPELGQKPEHDWHTLVWSSTAFPC
jgi:hypothetical protein